MARARKRHVQQEIRWPNKAGDLRGRSRERKAKGKAKRGRPPKPNAGVSHAKRPELPANAAPQRLFRLGATVKLSHR